MTRPQKLIPVAGPAREPGGTPAGLTRPLDYPGQAPCGERGEPVSCERRFTGTRGHIERFPDPGSKQA